MHQQSQVLSMKQKEMSAERSDEESIDLDNSEESLYQVCGAQLHRMIQVRYEKCKDGKNKDKFQSEIQFLKLLTNGKMQIWFQNCKVHH